MFGVSQKLLKIWAFIFVFGNLLFGMELKFIGSMDSGPEGIHLKRPLNVFISKDGKIYITDTGNRRFVSYSTNLQPLKYFNAGGSLHLPVAMVKDSKGNIYYIERATNSISLINLKKRKIIKKNLKIFPHRMCLCGKNIATIDRLSGEIVILTEKMEISQKLVPHIPDFKGFFDLKVKNHNICGMENISGRIFCFNTKTGKITSTILSKNLPQPISFDIDENGNIFVLDRYLGKIFVFSSKGRYLTSLLRKGEKEGELKSPWQILIEKRRIYVVDEGNGRVDVFEF